MWQTIGAVLLSLIIIIFSSLKIDDNWRKHKKVNPAWPLMLFGGAILFFFGFCTLILSLPKSEIMGIGMTVSGLVIGGGGVWGICQDRKDTGKFNFKWLIVIIGGIALVFPNIK